MARRFILSRSTNIFANLAFEAALYAQPLAGPTLLLYANSPCVILGRNQNVWRECRVEEIRRRGIAICRRFSGGGAVYQDLGNLCFSFMLPVAVEETPMNRRSESFGVVLRALGRVGVEAQLSGRNDIAVEGKKVSGSAFRFELGGPRQQRRLLHHGTLLVGTDFSVLEQLLSPSPHKLRAKGIDSVRARVANLSEFRPGLVPTQLADSLEAEFGGARREADEAEMASTPGFATELARLRDPDFVFNESSEFSVVFEGRLSFGGVELQAEVENGELRSCKLFSDCLTPEMIEHFAAMLNQRRPPYSAQGFAALADEPFACAEEAACFRELLAWVGARVG